MAGKIFDDRGFLTSEGKLFVESGFTKEVKKIFATASSYGDTLTISCILKSIVGDCATNQCYNIRKLQESDSLEIDSSTLPQAKVIPFRKKIQVAEKGSELNPSLNGLSDIPPIDE